MRPTVAVLIDGGFRHPPQPQKNGGNVIRNSSIFEQPLRFRRLFQRKDLRYHRDHHTAVDEIGDLLQVLRNTLHHESSPADILRLQCLRVLDAHRAHDYSVWL
ncbi:MAG TPA: hypothetical protein VGS79_04050 [Puia sp.]|nr:hypothetical protein [Puia sp.]